MATDLLRRVRLLLDLESLKSACTPRPLSQHLLQLHTLRDPAPSNLLLSVVLLWERSLPQIDQSFGPMRCKLRRSVDVAIAALQP